MRKRCIGYALIFAAMIPFSLGGPLRADETGSDAAQSTGGMSCPSNLILNTESGKCGAIANYTVPSVSIGLCGLTLAACIPPPGTFCGVGVTPVTCTATSLCGVQTCGFTITVKDIFPPAIICPPNQFANATSGRCDAVVQYPAPTVSDNCEKVTVSCSPPSGSTFPVGTTIVTCTATDSSGNKSSCSFTVTVKDNQPPTIACPPNQTANAGTACAAVVNYPSPTVSDNCPNVAVNCVPLSGSSFPVGTTTVVCTATDKGGNKASCSFSVTVKDNQPPTVACPPNLTLAAGKDSCGATLTYTIPAALDNCPNVSVTCVPPPGTFCGIGTKPVVCIARDLSGNADTCSFTVTVKDLLPPIIVCPPNQTANAGANCAAVVNYPAPTVIENCPPASVNCTPPSGSTFQVGTSTVVCIASDNAGNKDTCSFTVTVKDSQPPTIACPSNQTVTAAPGECEAVVTYPSPTTSDNCPPVTVDCTPPSGSSFPVGTTTVVCSATDKSGNKATCSFTVTVRDIQPPVVVCPPNQTANAGPGCEAIVNYPAPTVSDNCPNPTVSCNPPSGSSFAVGTKTVVCIATDKSGNKDTCSFTVTVRDNQPPTVVCPANITLTAGKDSCGAIAIYTPPVAVDNCPGATVVCVPPSGTFCGIGTKPVVCIATDVSGNKDTCSFTITVKDFVPPVLVCPPNQTANASPGQCAAVVSYPAPTVVENCPPATVSCTPPSGSTFPVGNTAVVCIAADAAGNKDTCSFTVTVKDNQPPIVSCPSNQIVIAGGGQCAATVQYPLATLSDNCPGGTVSCVPPSGSSFSVGTTTVVCIGTDAAGNKDTCSFTVTVRDNQPPQIVCPPNQTVGAGANCAAVVSYPPPTASDNCPEVTFSCSPPSGSSFQVGTSTVVCIATDKAGNKDTCSFTVTVRDNQPPSIACPPNQTVSANPGQCAATVTYPAPTTSDNCPGNVTVDCTPPSGSTFQVGTSTVVCIATDNAGNKDTCSFTVTVRDNQPPSIVCPSNQTVNAGANCVAAVTYPAPTVSDNCPDVAFSCVPPSGSPFPVGNTTVVCIAVDKSGNKDTCSFTVTVRDNQPPQVVCPPNIILPAIKDSCGAIAVYTPPVAVDNCPASVVVDCIPPPGSFCGIGVTTVKCIAKDKSGNADTCQFTITVQDLLPPVLVCPSGITLQAGEDCGAIAVYTPPVAIDNCGPATVECTPPSGTFCGVGVTLVTCTATDRHGNKTTCGFSITVEDVLPPVVVCPSGITVHTSNSEGAICVYTPPVATDNCPPATVECVPASGSFCGIGITLVTCTATDKHGNKSTCGFAITVVLDVSAPKSPVIQSAKPNGGTVDVSWAAVPDKDLKEYRVHRDTSSGFGTAEVIGHTASTLYQDSSPVVGKPLYYRLTAVDSAGNESPPSGAASTFFGTKGDLNLDGQLSPPDLVILMNCLNEGTGDCPLEIGDVNCDGELLPSDLIILMLAVFSGASFPC